MPAPPAARCTPEGIATRPTGSDRGASRSSQGSPDDRAGGRIPSLGQA